MVGASGWWTRVPYNPDIEAAFNQAQQTTLQTRDYFAWWNTPWASTDELEEMVEDLGGVTDDVAGTIERIRAGQPPTSIDAIRVLADADGTHSILDMAGISEEPIPMMMCPLPVDALERTFGTDQPSPERVEEHRDDLVEFMEGWVGVYVIAYTDGQPTDIYFGGITGD